MESLLVLLLVLLLLATTGRTAQCCACGLGLKVNNKSGP
jgi:hypothetical protein